MRALDELLILTRDAEAAGEGARFELAREHRRGRLHRISEGVYIASEAWAALDETDRHLLVAHAAQRIRRRRLVFSHWTAAAAWGLPLVDPIPVDAHIVDRHASGGRTDDRLVRHCVGLPTETVWIDGLEVTELARTAVDLARVAPFGAAVAVMDAALARLGEDAELEAHLGPPRARGVSRARRVIGFADPLAESPGESLSRAAMATAGIPEPVLQHRFEDAVGSMRVDFWWPRFNVVGEFDGAVKYHEPVYLSGRTPREALLDEKAREDRIRALGPTVTRWRWDLARNPARLRAHLLRAGVRDERYRKW